MKKMTITNENCKEILNKALKKLKRPPPTIGFCEVHKRRQAFAWYNNRRLCQECIILKVGKIKIK